MKWTLTEAKKESEVIWRRDLPFRVEIPIEIRKMLKTISKPVIAAAVKINSGKCELLVD